MRTFFIFISLVLVLGLGYLGYAHFTGGAVPIFGLPIGGERATVRARTLSFFEHVKFKNTSALVDFVDDTVSRDDLMAYLYKSLAIDLENVDLVSVSVDDVELNSTATRARVRTHVAGQTLMDSKPFAHSKIIFLYKAADGDWLVDTKSVAP